MPTLQRSLRSRLLVGAVLPAALLTGTLAGCADAPANSSGGTATTQAASASGDFAKITVTPGKDAATAPTISLPTKPFRVQETQHRILKEGTGAVIAEPSAVTANWARYSGVDGAAMGSSYGAKPASLHIEPNSDAAPGFIDALKGQKVGTQALVAVPASKILTESQLAKGMTLDDTVLFVLDVVSARPVLTKATGTAVPPKAGLPTVDVPDDPTKPATFTVPSPTPIKETLVQPLIVGTGPKVEKGQTIRVRYTGATWRTPDKPFDYSGKTPKTTAEFPIGVGQLIKAWDNTIPGQTVGSRLLVIVQPADGYGADGNPQADIKGDDVLIFVMDILDAWSD
ncbi:MAG: FKBP-type peptidyl-prolyl cis-trans isomerase [Austwickia sp.]|nr:FKBP-type peptidyl-prolyl cis-trans isomerase [Austwickia sp.]